MHDSSAVSRQQIVSRTLAVWLLLIVAEIFHGILRTIALVPLVGQFHSNQIGVFTGSLIILGVAYLFTHWIGAKSRRDLFMVGAIWLLLTIAFEVLFGRFVAGLSWKRIASDYDIWRGGLMPLGLLVLWFAPMIAARYRNRG